MPTGYTAPIEDGTITELRDYALRCARAFGALIHMRDEPLDAELHSPVTNQIDSYYARSVRELESKCARIEALTPVQCVAQQNDEISRQRAYREEYIAERTRKVERYAAMRAKVEIWEPPTPEHGELKRFMLQQLEVSVGSGAYTPPEPVVQDPEQWRLVKLEGARKELQRAREGLAEQQEQARKSAAWVDALKAAF